MADTAVEMSGMTQALMRAFQTWAKPHPKYARFVVAFSDPMRDILCDAFSELQDDRYRLKPAGWEVWWATHHNRYIRRTGVTQKELLRVHEVMYHFLTAFARGELEKQSDSKKGKGKAIS